MDPSVLLLVCSGTLVCNTMEEGAGVVWLSLTVKRGMRVAKTMVVKGLRSDTVGEFINKCRYIEETDKILRVEGFVDPNKINNPVELEINLPLGTLCETFNISYLHIYLRDSQSEATATPSSPNALDILMSMQKTTRIGQMRGKESSTNHHDHGWIKMLV